jgi:hypothetical protein
MIVSNIFRAIGEFCTNVLFVPFNAFRSLDSWWGSNIFNMFIILLGFIALFYWINQMIKQSKEGAQ